MIYIKKKSSLSIKIFAFFLLIVFIFLGIWQASRFFSQKKRFFEIEKTKQEFLISKYKILNQELLFEFKNDQSIFFFKKVIACGTPVLENLFIFNSLLLNDVNKKQYKIIMNLDNNDYKEKLLFFFDAFKTKNEAIEKINQIKQKKFEYSCFSGVLEKIPNEKNKNFLQKVADFNGFNKKNNSFYNIDGKDINVSEQISKNQLGKINKDFEKINFILDPEKNNLDSLVKKNYKHHFFYMIMWFGLSIYMIYFLIKS